MNEPRVVEYTRPRECDWGPNVETCIVNVDEYGMVQCTTESLAYLFGLAGFTLKE